MTDVHRVAQAHVDQGSGQTDSRQLWRGIVTTDCSAGAGGDALLSLTVAGEHVV
jgi:hypothetical protein